MPVTTTFPGVYIEELPSGVHTITGVATSIAAFIGWAPKGPVNKATLVLSLSDYINQFGPLDSRSLLGYSVSQFFANGGSQAYIVRVAVDQATATMLEGPPTKVPAANLTVPAPASITLGTSPNSITATAQNPGIWGNDYWIAIKNQIDPVTKNPNGRFQLQVVYGPKGATTQTVVESFENLSMTQPDPQGRFVVDVVNNSSKLITVSVPVPPAPPAPP